MKRAFEILNKYLNRPWKKILAYTGVGLLFVSFTILPWVAEWYIESNDEELVGRQVEMDDLHFNILTGGIAVDKLVVFEPDTTLPFVQVKRIYVNLEWWSIIFGTYALGEVAIDQPQITILQNGAAFNFDDLVKRFTAVDSSALPEEPSEPVAYRVENFKLSQGTFTYDEVNIKAEVKMISINNVCPLISSKDPVMKHTFDFAFDKGGKAAGTFELDQQSLAYRTKYKLDSFNIGIFQPYIALFMRTGSLTGLVSSHQEVAGNFNNPSAIATSGEAIVNDFALMDPNESKLAGLSEWRVEIDSVDLSHEIYDFQYVSVDKPYLRVELFDDGNNFSKLMKDPSTDTTKIGGVSSDSLSRAAAYGNVFALLAAYVREMSRMYAFSAYSADSLVIRHGTLVFNDFTLHSRFNYLLEDLMMKADKVSSANANIKVEAASILNTSGRLAGQLLIDPHGFSDLDIDYSIRGLRVSDFNPYSDYYVAHPFTDGICTYVSKTTVRNYQLKSNHVLDIESIAVGKKVKNNTAYNIPMRLAVALLRDKNGDVHLELPIEGDLNDPKFKVGKVIWQVFKNLIGKAIAAPGRLLAGKAGVEEKLLEGFKWEPLQTDLTQEQMSSLDAMVKALGTTPEMKVEIVRVFNQALETDEIAVREGKKKYLFHHRRINSEDEVQPNEMAQVDGVQHNDSTFNAYLNQQVKTDAELVSVYEKSRKLAGNEKLQRKLAEIYKKRTDAVMNYLVTTKGLSADRFVIGDPPEPPKLAYATQSNMTFRFYVDE